MITEVTVRILPKPTVARAALLGFPSIAAAGQCVADIIADGIIPAGMELMDKAAVAATEAFCSPGYPADAEAVLIAELDGTEAEVNALIKRVSAIAEKAGASSVRTSADEAERLLFWAGRKNAFPAVGRLSPDYMCMDGTIPRRCLAEVLSGISKLSDSFELPVANVFHAGDGNLHPLILFDANDDNQAQRAEAMGGKILELCIEVGGTITGEHGVGREKINHMCIQFSTAELQQFHALRKAFDSDGLMNPGKAVPTLNRCAEFGRMHVHQGQTAFPHLPRF